MVLISGYCYFVADCSPPDWYIPETNPWDSKAHGYIWLDAAEGTYYLFERTFVKWSRYTACSKHPNSHAYQVRDIMGLINA